MGVMDKFLNYMKLNENDDEYYDNDYIDDDEPEEAAPAPKKSFVSKAVAPEEDYDSEPAPVRKPVSRPAATANKITPLHSGGRKSSAAGMEVCVIKPASFEDAREITETLLKNRTIVMNLEGLDVEVAQRILDFTSGSCFAINGNLQKISMYIFIITPASVDISGDFQNILGGFDASTLNTVL